MIRVILAAVCLVGSTSVAGAQAFPDTVCELPRSQWQDGLPNSILVGEASGQEAIIAFGYPNGGGAAVRAPGYVLEGQTLVIAWRERLRGVAPDEMPEGSLATVDLRLDQARSTMDVQMTFFNGPGAMEQTFMCRAS